MNLLEKLPVELFHQVASYLGFLDRKAISCTSNYCHVLIGPVKFPDQLSWITHLCRTPPTSLADPMLSRPIEVVDCLIRMMHYNLILDDKMGRFRL